ncbi:hypothetical protein EGW08_013530 [Elysia chlorotica]|uniref:TIR domain-containing protein n=1 Tax=Elysia chlorotica TaxID=188477 RepID=A0A433TAW3_ELYCH|nr:hypothetical protein EGW08_013530 [Elysia chlorotica]
MLCHARILIVVVLCFTWLGGCHSRSAQYHGPLLGTSKSNTLRFDNGQKPPSVTVGASTASLRSRSRQVLHATALPVFEHMRSFIRPVYFQRTKTSPAGCPEKCLCQTGLDRAISVVDCSSQMLVDVPDFPVSVEEIRLQNNLIQTIRCTSFEGLVKLKTLDLSENRIDTLYNCSFDGLASLERLWLGQNQLSFLPADVFQSLRSLELLDLGRNGLTHLGNNTFHGLSSVVSLWLQENQLHYRPGTFEVGTFRGLTSLESLHLEGNQQDMTEDFTYPDQALSCATTLRRLWLDGHPKALGPGFLSLTQLTHLSFAADDVSSCYMLSDIPPDFFKNLGTKEPLYLNMSSCSFTFISPELFKYVPNIFSLDLSFNQNLLIDGFEKASEGLQNSNLTVLNISQLVNAWVIYNEIRNTTFRYLKHTKLRVLRLDGCSLINIAPQAILDLPQSIEFLSLHDNKIINAEALLSMNHLQNLKDAIISRQVHYKSDMARAAPPRPGLVSLHRSEEAASTSHYSDMARAAPPRPGLVSLHRSEETASTSHYRTRNNPSRVQPGLDQNKLLASSLHMPLKERVDSHGQLPIRLGSDFCGDLMTAAGQSSVVSKSKNDFIPIPLPRRLERLDASDINLDYDIPRIQFFNNRVLRYLDLSSNHVKCFGGPVSGLPALQLLDLSKNWCFRMNPLFFSYMPSLKTLLLQENMLGKSLAEDVDGVTFSALSSLESLDLSQNIIEDLSESAFLHNTNLRLVNLSNNELNQFSPSLASNTKLQTLDLSHNLLTEISETTCNQLLYIKKHNSNFTVRLAGNHRLVCDCENLYFLNFVSRHPEVFETVTSVQCRLPDGSNVSYDHLERFLPELYASCISQTIFQGVLVAFFLLAGGLAMSALYHFKRWQWRYLYYVGKSRLHMGSMILANQRVAQAFITYDQENRRLRTLMRNVFLPRLHGLGVTTVLGETDFEAGFKAPSIAGAVTNTSKTLVFLSPDIFQDFYRQLEVNMAILHELHLRRPVLIPVLLLREEALSSPPQGNQSRDQTSCQPPAAGDGAGIEGSRTNAADVRQVHSPHRPRARRVDDFTRFMQLLRDFPPEISAFLKGQVHRCLVYTGDTASFWEHLKTVIQADENN